MFFIKVSASLTDFKSKFDVDRKDSDCYNSSSQSGSQQPHPPPLLPLPTPQHPFSSSSSSGAGSCPVATAAHLPDSTTDSWSGYYGAQRQDGVSKPFGSKSVSLKQRCRDYDGRNGLRPPLIAASAISFHHLIFFFLTVSAVVVILI